MASGVKVSEEVKDIINQMKVVKNDADTNERLRLVTFEIAEGFITIDKTFRQKDFAADQDVFMFFLSLLDVKLCRYLLYDCHYETKETGKKEELVFVMWASEAAPIKAKMQYASSKDSLKKVMTGIKHELQMNDLSDYGSRELFASKMGSNVTTLEGCRI
ncbi:non-muscle cofilin 1-like [Nematolebias whitei]|uniref:non-muscle cofilin 1-like n=1 Tax=Nematolebias whitei TaxID=451745 RepID=UPI00189951FB|nr:non-muscle cofilin 1-like [Nematolebias whitei]